MRTFRNSLVVVLALLPLLFCGCSNGFAQRILGLWYSEDGTISYEYFDTGEFLYNDYEVDYRVRGKYLVDGETLRMKEMYGSWENGTTYTISFEDEDNILIFHNAYDEGDKQTKDVRYIRQAEVQ